MSGNETNAWPWAHVTEFVRHPKVLIITDQHTVWWPPDGPKVKARWQANAAIALEAPAEPAAGE